jgi:hypothetical protein
MTRIGYNRAVLQSILGYSRAWSPYAAERLPNGI